MADIYTHGHHDSVLRSHRWRTAENSAGYLLDKLAPGMSLLDVGCGPGTLTADLARRVAPGRVVALDRAQAVLTEARANLAGATNVEVAVGDVYRLGFEDASFDVVHAHQVLQHLTDPVAALTEMGRVCRPGGLVAVRDADYGAMTWGPALPGLDRWMEIYQAVARHNDAEPDAGRHLHSWVLEAGLGDVRLTTSTWRFAVPKEREWWGSLWADRMTRSDLATQALEYGAATPADLEEVAAAWRDWIAAPDAWFAVPHTEVLAEAPIRARRGAAAPT